MPEKKPYSALLNRDGTSTGQRAKTVLLRQTYFQPDERSWEDIYAFAKAFAQKINFYGFEGFENSPYTSDLKIEDCKDGDWSGFFPDISSADFLNKNDFDPYLALYLAFLKLFSHAQNHLNQFTEKHLDFYYKNILNLDARQGLEESAYVIFELAKTANELLVEKGTPLDAGKTGSSAAVYNVEEDVVINRASVAGIKSTYISEAENDVVRFAQQTDASDGISKPLPAAAPYYDAFGLRHIPEDVIPKAKIGFAIAAPVLLLKDGIRTITFTIDLSNVPVDLTTADNRAEAELFLTGEKNWLGGYVVPLTYEAFRNNRQTVKITYTLTEKEPAVLPYNTVIHKNSYNTQYPLAQILIDTTRPDNAYKYLKNAVVENISVEVDVKEVTALELENDNGSLDAKKPFHPFGTAPKKGSAFTVYYEELMQKNVTEYQFTVEWLSAPENFSAHYSGYGGNNNNSSFTAVYKTADGTAGTTALFNIKNAANAVHWPAAPFLPVWYGWGAWQSPVVYQDFYSLYANPNFKKVIQTTATLSAISGAAAAIAAPRPSKGFIRFELTRSFMHELYGKVFAQKAMEQAGQTTVTLPNEPYMPTIKSISLNYKAVLAESRLNSISFDQYNKKELQFFHIGVFGQSEQHGYLKTFVQQEFGPAANVDPRIFLFDRLPAASLYIGLKEAQPGQSISLLLQLAAGSADPDADPETIEWHVLCHNEWRSVTSREMLKNETNHLLQAGIVRIVLPTCSTTDNTIMESGLTWLRASVLQNPAAVCLFEKIIAQAARASFQKPEGSPASGFIKAGTIAKPVNKSQSIKQLSQPFSSFGGQATEDAALFKLRVSERLRHKQRGVMNWDYERLVLQQFPELYKVKCLNHFNDADDCCKDIAPGSVTLVVVPNIYDRNFYNPLQPKVNTNTRQKIKEFLQPLVSFFTTLYVVNPDYETIQLDFKVRFLTAGDFGLCSDKLNQALKNYLTPWASGNSTALHFGGAVYKSSLLNFIEEQPYVDFVTELKMFHIDESGNRSADLDRITIVNPKAIMVSAAQHNIRAFTTADVCT